MTDRSAHATIKGYFYQFDQTIARILEAGAPESSVVVEGIEDIDLEDGDDSTFVQCKYYEGSTYNHSVIKDAVIQMLKHFHARGCQPDQKFKYQVYGHYKEGQDKLSAAFDLDFLKKNFLTYEHDKKIHAVHAELGVSDHQLTSFHGLLSIDLHAPSYDQQQKQVMAQLVSHIPGCATEDAEVFYYPNAINVIQRLAIKANVDDRKITKSRFVSEVNRKDLVLGIWLLKKFGADGYAKLIKRGHFKFSATKVPKASRIFVMDMTGEFDVSKAIALLAKISTSLSHVEHKRTPQEDRFCPYVLLRGVAADDLVLLKRSLLQQGIEFSDGYPFKGSEFHAARLAATPTKDNAIRLKFIPAAKDLASVVTASTGSIIHVFDFFKTAPLDAGYVPPSAFHHPIKVDTTYFISEVL